MSKRVNYIEIDLPKCSLTYGTAPCTAALGVTGAKKCFNTRATCQDISNYDEETEVLRLSQATLDLDQDIISIPNIIGVEYTPSQLSLGESIGARAVCTITCNDHPTPDTGAAGDKYRSDRSYNPYNQGSFWAKFKARQPFLRGRTLRWYTGRVGQTISGMERHTYVIDRIEGPGTDGLVRIIAKDPLTLTDDERAQAPRLSRGLVGDSGGISDSDTTLTLSPAGIGDLDYEASGYIAIGGNEICGFTRAGDVLTITRGKFNTEAQSHDEEDRVQMCIEYSGEDPADIIYDLMTTYGNIPTGFINLSNWQGETGTYIGRVYTALIAEPTSVVDLVNEILEQAGITIWWDELGETIKLQVLRDIPRGGFIYDENVIMSGSFQQSDNQKKRVSQVWTYFGQINPLEGQDDPKNYKNTLATVDLESETNYGTPAYKTIFSRWITQFGRTAAERLNNIVIARYKNPPRTFTFNLLRDSGIPNPVLGGGCNVESYFIQDDEGNQVSVPAQITKIKTSSTAWGVSAEELTIAGVIVDDPTVKEVNVDADTLNFNLRDAFITLYNEADPGDTIICNVRSGVVVGSDNVNAPAFDTGEGWPEGITIQLNIMPGAYIVGKGGDGGDSQFIDSNTHKSYPGQNGGTALKVSEDIEIINNGIIGGGGGGGGGASAREIIVIITPGPMLSGGGGAAGRNVGSGGSVNNFLGESGKNGLLENGANGQSVYGKNVIVTSGNGGDLGQPGTAGSVTGSYTSRSQGAGGAAGIAVDGDSLVTWTTLGDIRGNRIN